MRYLFLTLILLPLLVFAASETDKDAGTPAHWIIGQDINDEAPYYDGFNDWSIIFFAKVPSTASSGTHRIFSRNGTGASDNQNGWFDGTTGVFRFELDPGPGGMLSDATGKDFRDDTWYLHAVQADDAREVTHKYVPVCGSVVTEETLGTHPSADYTVATDFRFSAFHDGTGGGDIAFYYIGLDGTDDYSDADLEAIACGTAPQDLAGQSFSHCYTVDGTGNNTDNCGALNLNLVQGTPTDVAAPTFVPVPSITSIGGDDALNIGDLNFTVSGSDFESPQGTGTFQFCYNSETSCLTNTDIDSWGDLSIQADLLEASFYAGDIPICTSGGTYTCTGKVTNDSGQSDSLAITVDPNTSNQMVELSGTDVQNNTGSILGNSVDSWNTGDQIVCSDVTDTNGDPITLNTDSTVTIGGSGSGTDSFDCYAIRVGEANWESFTVNLGEDGGIIPGLTASPATNSFIGSPATNSFVQ